MFKGKTEQVEVYFICYKKKEMELVESYYDEVLDIHYWYFNAYLAYQHWKKNFKGLALKEMSKDLLVVAASRYIIYQIENKEVKNKKEIEKLKKDLNKIQIELERIIRENELLSKL